MEWSVQSLPTVMVHRASALLGEGPLAVYEAPAQKIFQPVALSACTHCLGKHTLPCVRSRLPSVPPDYFGATLRRNSWNEEISEEIINTF